jgi:ornithine carbamoyltransferase
MKRERPLRSAGSRLNHSARDGRPKAARINATRKRPSRGSSPGAPSPNRHLVSLFDITPADVDEILEISAELKTRLRDGDRPPILQGRVLTLVFEKPSLRTRNSFEAAMIQLGGGSVFLSAEHAGLNGRESLPDVARVLSSYSDVVVMRTYLQSLIEDFARLSRCPVVNGLSDELHPCQALTDLFTIQETFGRLKGLHLVYIGDGNNVAASLAMTGAYTKMPLTICSPKGFELSEAILSKIRDRVPGAEIQLVSDPAAAVKDADIVYTDVWASMGQESQAEHRRTVFAPYQVNAALMARAPRSAKFMHDLPARRGLEVTDDVMDGPQSIVFQQAENRMHLAKGLLVWLLRARDAT